MRARNAGFTYLGALLAVVVMGMLLAAAGQAWETQAMREREEELLFSGGQYRDAIASFVAASPGAQRYPRRLSDLLQDPRHPGVVRHLRRLYQDPMTGGEWGLLPAPDGGIAGVYSKSGGRPFKTSNFPPEYAALEGKYRYADWHFAHLPPSPPGSPGKPGGTRP